MPHGTGVFVNVTPLCLNGAAAISKCWLAANVYVCKHWLGVTVCKCCCCCV